MTTKFRTIMLNLLARSSAQFQNQKALGLYEGSCSNRTSDGKGCIVGLLVGITHFEVGSTRGSTALTPIELQSAWGHDQAVSWSELSPEQREKFHEVLNKMQSLHDSLHVFGTAGYCVCVASLEILRARLKRGCETSIYLEGVMTDSEYSEESYSRLDNRLMAVEMAMVVFIASEFAAAELLPVQ
jgi:hypothetical protein